MKKLAVKKTARNAQAPPRGNGRREPGDPFAAADLKLLRKLLAQQLTYKEDSLEDMVEAFLSSGPERLEEMPSVEAMSELAEELEHVRLDASGGDPEARRTLTAVRKMIDEAAAGDEIHPGVLIVLGRLFSGAEVDIGEAARASMGRIASQGFLHETEDPAYHAFVQPALLNLEGDAFTVHGEIRSMIDIFPLPYRAAMVESLAADPNRRGGQIAVGFLLAPQEPVASAAVKGLAACARRGGLDGECRRRMDMIRAWLPPSRREALDAAIPATGPAALRRPAEFVKAIVSVCDGSGAAALLATVKRGSNYSVASVMAKPWGVADAFVVEDLPKSKAEEIALRATMSVPTAQVSLAAWTQLVRLALGRNLAHGAPPPFALVRALEAAGFEALAPDASTTAEIIDQALAGFSDRDDPAAIADAHRSVGDSNAAGAWFEAGDAVDAILKRTDTVDDGAQALLERHLPTRRAFWASQCALSALVLKGYVASREGSSKHLALVGRDLLRGLPMHAIPLMRQIAEKSAAVHFVQR